METTSPSHHEYHKNFYHHDDEASFIEMDPRLPPSKRFVRVSSDHFGFDFLTLTNSSLGLVRSEELISNNGFLAPETVQGSNNEDECFIITAAAGVMNSSVSSSDYYHRNNRIRYSAFRRCKRMSRRFFERCFKCLMRPFSGSSKRRESTRMVMCKKSSVVAADDNWRRSCDSECSIYEAVQHCKRSY